jgi:hypothetical protein
MDKKGMELSINFLVGIIFGVVLLGLGLGFAGQLLTSSEKLLEQGLPDYYEIEAKNCVQRGDRVCIPQAKVNAPVNKVVSFGVVVNNIYGEERSFKPHVVFSRGKTESGTSLTAGQIQAKDWTFESFLARKLENNEATTVEIPIRAPKGTKPGTYTFNVNVCFDGAEGDDAKCSFPEKSLYSPTQQITITVT